MTSFGKTDYIGTTNEKHLYFSNANAILIQAHVDSDLALLSQWAAANGFRINASKHQSIVLARRYQRSQVASVKFLLNDTPILSQGHVKYLGVLVDQDLDWSQQVNHVRRKSLAALAILQQVSSYVYVYHSFHVLE